MLDQMTNRLRAQVNIEGVLATVLNDVVALHGAEFGALQLLDKETLWVVGERNLGPNFVSAFAQVTEEDVSGCGRALRENDLLSLPTWNRTRTSSHICLFSRSSAFERCSLRPLLPKVANVSAWSQRSSHTLISLR